MLTRLAHVIMRYRWAVIGVWVGLTLFGVFATTQVADRWYAATAIPGQPAYEASQRALHELGIGDRTPIVVVFHTSGDITQNAAVAPAMERAAATRPGAFTSSFFTTGSNIYLSSDRHTAFQMIYPPGADDVNTLSHPEAIRTAAATGLPAGIDVNVTGRLPLDDASRGGSGAGTGVLLEVLIGGVGALLILLFVFGTLPAVLAPLGIAIAAILNTFTLVWGLTYLTDVSVIVQFLIGLVGLGLAIDYALVVIFRFRDELREGEDVETALVETMTHAGKSVVTSG